MSVQQEERADFLKLLLDHKANINAVDAQGNTALIVACKEELSRYRYSDNAVNLLLDSKADVTLKNQQGFSALSYVLAFCKDQALEPNAAAYQRNHAINFYKKAKAIIIKLLNLGADPNDATQEGMQALMVALKTDNLDQEEPKLLKILFQHPKLNIDKFDKDQKTLLSQALDSTEYGRTLLADSVVVVKMLLERNANPNLADCHGVTPLMKAAKLFYDDAMILVPLLLKAKASLEAVDQNNQTALFYACQKSAEAAQLLLESKANLNHKDKDGNSPLHCAIANLNICNIDCIKILLERGANPNLRNNKGQDALAFFAEVEKDKRGFAPHVMPQIKKIIEEAIKRKKDAERLRLLSPENQVDAVTVTEEVGVFAQVRKFFG